MYLNYLFLAGRSGTLSTHHMNKVKILNEDHHYYISSHRDEVFYSVFFFKHNIFWLIVALYLGMQDDQQHYILSSWLLDRCTYGFFSLCVIYLFLFIYFPWKCILVVNIYILCININYKNFIFLQSWKLKMLQVTTKKKSF